MSDVPFRPKFDMKAITAKILAESQMPPLPKMEINVVVHNAEGEVVKIEPGDKIIVRVPLLSGNQAFYIKRIVEQWAGPGVAVLVVPQGVEVEVVRPKPEEAAQPESWRDKPPLL